jgi:hypothetical protein
MQAAGIDHYEPALDYTPDEVFLLARAVLILSDELARERGVKLW